MMPDAVVRKPPKNTCQPWVCKAIPKQQSLWPAGKHSIARLPYPRRPEVRAVSKAQSADRQHSPSPPTVLSTRK